MDSDQEKTLKQRAREALPWIVGAIILITLLFWVFTGDNFFIALFVMLF